MKMKKFALCALLALSSTMAFADDPQTPPATPPAGHHDAGGAGDGSGTPLSGLGFSLGVGFSHTSKSDVNEATIDGSGVVRVTDDTRTKRGFWLQTHYIMGPVVGPLYMGPFLAAQFSSDNSLINGLGTGVVFALRRTPAQGNTTVNSAFNIAVGWQSTRVQTLADGFVDGQAAPAGEKAVRFRKQDAGGLVVLFSFDFYSVPGTQNFI